MTLALRKNANIIVDMPDGSTWLVPVMVIARHRATYYAPIDYKGNVNRSLEEDTWPLFMEDKNEVLDWAANNMNWSDVMGLAVLGSPPEPMTDEQFQEGWLNGAKRIA